MGLNPKELLTHRAGKKQEEAYLAQQGQGALERVEEGKPGGGDLIPRLPEMGNVTGTLGSCPWIQGSVGSGAAVGCEPELITGGTGSASPWQQLGKRSCALQLGGKETTYQASALPSTWA